MRLQVFLSHSGACSRRKALELIFSGKVSVNGKTVTEPSYDIIPASDKVKLDGKNIILPEKKVYILLNKPKGAVSTVSDPHAEKTVLDLLPHQLRRGLHPVGRLDQDTTGLLLLTNDGNFTLAMTHPSFKTEKTYELTLNKPVEERDIRSIETGIVLEGKKTLPCRIRKLSDERLEMTLREGRKRQIRKVFSLFHYHVVDLKRTRQAGLELGSLEEGQWRFLTDGEVRQLLKKQPAR